MYSILYDHICAERLSKMVNILFLAANPLDMNRLNLKDEYDAIDPAIRTGVYRSQFNLIPLWEVRVGEVQDALRRHAPHIVHFSGHGSQSDAIYVENEQGFAQPISATLLAELFEIAGKQVRCVVLNACYTDQQATTIAHHVDYVIGMRGEADDAAAICFASAFYQALSAGENLPTAFRSGCLQVDLEYPNHTYKPELLSQKRTPDPFLFVAKTAINHSTPNSLKTTVLPRHNLSGRNNSQLVGRQQELDRVYAWLHPTSDHRVVAVEGIGGIGKSALALAAAYYYLENDSTLPLDERFAAIISTSAKQTEYTISGSTPTLQAISTLARIYETIAIVLEDGVIKSADHDQRHELVKQALIHTRTLLIIDNLDTIDDQQVIAFLNALPPHSKAIVTTQLSKHPWVARLRLHPLQYYDVKAYLEQWPQARACLTDFQLKQLYKHIGGIPLALRLCFATIEYNDDFDRWFAQLTDYTDDDVVAFCVGAAWRRLTETSKAASEVLKLLSLFDAASGATADMLVSILGRSEPRHVILNQLATIINHSLANRTEHNRYTVLPLVQQYLARCISPTELDAYRLGQVRYYLERFLQPYLVHIDFICGTSSVTSDAIEIDNLELLLTWAQGHIPATDYLRFADGFSSLLYLVGLVKRAIEIATAGLSVAQSLQDQEKQYDFYNKLILYYTWSDRFVQAETALQTALELGAQIPTYRPDNVLDYQGAYLMRRNVNNNLLTAYTPLRKSAELRENFASGNQDPRVAVLGRFLIGVWYYRMARHLADRVFFTPAEAALFENIEELAHPPLHSPSETAQLLLNLGEVSLRAGLALAEEVNFDRGRSYILNYLGNISTARRAWAEAEAALTLALRLAEDLVDRRRIARVQESLFHLFLAQGKQTEANLWAQLALERFSLLGMTLEQQEIQDALNRSIK